MKWKVFNHSQDLVSQLSISSATIKKDNRCFINEHVNERALREIYLRNFQILIDWLPTTWSMEFTQLIAGQYCMMSFIMSGNSMEWWWPIGALQSKFHKISQDQTHDIKYQVLKNASLLETTFKCQDTKKMKMISLKALKKEKLKLKIFKLSLFEFLIAATNARNNKLKSNWWYIFYH